MPSRDLGTRMDCVRPSRGQTCTSGLSAIERALNLSLSHVGKTTSVPVHEKGWREMVLDQPLETHLLGGEGRLMLQGNAARNRVPEAGGHSYCTIVF